MREPRSRTSLVPPYYGDYVPKLFTAADLEELPSHLPSGDVRYELHHGRLITLPMLDWQHSTAATEIVVSLDVQGEHRGFGKARSACAVILERNPDHVLVPDALFVANRRLPVRLSPEDYLETMPDLVVEVRSLNETFAMLERRKADYLKAGVDKVWIVDPVERIVVEYREGAEPLVYRENDTLGLEDIIPGFALPVCRVMKS
jgi:Uma2 family endonuclease